MAEVSLILTGFVLGFVGAWLLRERELHAAYARFAQEQRRADRAIDKLSELHTGSRVSEVDPIEHEIPDEMRMQFAEAADIMTREEVE